MKDLGGVEGVVMYLESAVHTADTGGHGAADGGCLVGWKMRISVGVGVLVGFRKLTDIEK